MLASQPVCQTPRDGILIARRGASGHDVKNGVPPLRDLPMEKLCEECALADAHAAGQHEVAAFGSGRKLSNESKDGLAAHELRLRRAARSLCRATVRGLPG